MDLKHVLAQKGNNAVETIGAQESVATLVGRLAERNIGALMVTGADGALVGIISERDIVRALAADRDNCLSHPVSRYMTREVVVGRLRDGAIDVLERMTKGRFRHMPVVEDGALVGVVSIGDVVKARIEELQRDNAALHAFIQS